MHKYSDMGSTVVLTSTMCMSSQLYTCFLCAYRCDTLSWADWAMEDLTKGYMYCCDVEKLRETVEYVPDLSDENGNWPSLMTDNAEAA